MTTVDGRQRAGRAMLLTTASAFALPVSAIVTGPLLSRSLGIDGRGALAAALAPPLLAVSLAHVGLPNAVGYHVSRRPGRAWSIAVRAFATSAIAGLLAFGVIAVFAPVLMSQFPGQRYLLLSIAATLPVSVSVEVARALAQGLGAYWLQLCERWISVLSRLLVVVLLFVTGTMTVERAAWATWGAVFCGGLVYLMLLPPLLRARSRQSGRAEMGVIVRYGLRSWAGNLANALVLRLDQVLLGVVRGGHDLGLYAVAVSVAEVPAAAINSAQGLLITATAEQQRRAGQLARALRIIVLLSVTGAVLGCAVTPTLVPLMFGAPFAASVPLTQILLVASVFSAVGVVAGAGLAAYGRPGAASVSQCAALVVTVVLLLLVVPAYGAIGAALASAVAYAIACALSLRLLAALTHLSYRELIVPTRADLSYLLSLVRPSPRK